MASSEQTNIAVRKELDYVLSLPSPRNKEEAKFQVIAPILASLGWEIRDGNQVSLEHPVGVGYSRQKGKVDFALKAANGRPVALIEAKAPDADLSKHVTQVLNYAFHEGVDVCALTTGLTWWLYLPREQGLHEDRKFAVLTIRKDGTTNDVAAMFVDFLGKHSLTSGEALGAAKSYHNRLRLEHMIPEVWKKMLGEPDRALVELVSQKVNESYGEAVSCHERIVEMLRTHSTLPVVNRKPKKIARARTRKKSEVPVLVLFGDRHKITANSKGALKVAEILQALDPQTFSQACAQCRFILSHIHPKRPSSTKLINNSGYYLDTNYNAKTLWEHARLMLRLCGHNDTEMQLIYEQ